MGEGEGREEESCLIHTGNNFAPILVRAWVLFVSRLVSEVNPDGLANPVGHQWNCGKAHQEEN